MIQNSVLSMLSRPKCLNKRAIGIELGIKCYQVCDEPHSRLGLH